MNLALADKIAKAVLYEGYLLYPYRSSAVKNRQRWNFGCLYPPDYCADPASGDAFKMQTEWLVESMEETTIRVRVRFLHLRQRQIFDGVTPVEKLEVDGKLYQTWEEAVERTVELPPLKLDASFTFGFTFPESIETERLSDSATICRTQQPIHGKVEVTSQRIQDHLIKLTIVIENESKVAPATRSQTVDARSEALLQSLLSTHTVTSIENGLFVSLLDPPPEAVEFAKQCKNIGVWPVLIGEEGDRDLILSSPIILYDYPQVAPESPGNLFDSTEIDEILTLRIMTLTDEEKREMRAMDDRTRMILERTESMPAEQFMKMHGVVRNLRAMDSKEES